MASERSDRDPQASVRFEPADVPPFLPLWLAAGLGGFVVIVLTGISLAYPLAVHQENRGPTQPLPPAPRLQVAPGQDLKTYRAAKRIELETSPTSVDAAMNATANQGWGRPK